jgi:hypothetical protein
MGIVQHAALHAQGQHIVWQQVLMKIQDTFRVVALSKGKPSKHWMHRIQKSNQWKPNIIKA